MKNKLQRIKEYIIAIIKDERGQSLVLVVIEILLAIFIAIVFIKYLILPALGC
jgi:hypothetical protein